MKPASIRTLALISHMALAAMISAVLAVVLYNYFTHSLTEIAVKNLERDLTVAQNLIHKFPQNTTSQTGLTELASGLSRDLAITVNLFPLDKSGGLLVTDSAPEVTAALSGKPGLDIRPDVGSREKSVFLASLVNLPKGGRLIVRVKSSLEPYIAPADNSLLLVLTVFLFGGLAAFFISIRAGRLLSTPLASLSRAAVEIASGKLSSRARRRPNNELGDFTHEFNKMADVVQKKIDTAIQARQRLEAILSSMSEGVLVTDGNGRVLMVNHALKEMLDLRTDPVGMLPSEMSRNPDLSQAMREARLGEKGRVSAEIRTVTNDERFLELTVVRLAPDDPVTGCVAVFHDLSTHKKVEQLRRDFVANVSHELRTPLTAIRGSAETLLQGALDSPDMARRFTEMILRHTVRLSRLSSDLLDLARMESGKASPKPTLVDLKGLMKSALSTVSNSAKDQDVNLKLIEPDPGLEFLADKEQMEQVLLNLLENAIKYTEPGGNVTIGAEPESDSLRLTVSDTGIGIEAEHLPRIFERFYRVDRERSRNLGGTGLGLSIVKHFTAANGGKVEVESTPGNGSKFHLVFPHGLGLSRETEK